MSLDVLITTSCPECGKRYEIKAGPHRPPPEDAVVHFMLPATRWWDDVVTTCSNIRMFCTADHVRDWAQRDGNEVGAIVALDVVWRLAQSWYGDRLGADYRPHSLAHNQRLLTEVGLAGQFWQLR